MADTPGVPDQKDHRSPGGRRAQSVPFPSSRLLCKQMAVGLRKGGTFGRGDGEIPRILWNDLRKGQGLEPLPELLPIFLLVSCLSLVQVANQDPIRGGRDLLGPASQLSVPGIEAEDMVQGTDCLGALGQVLIDRARLDPRRGI